jgi:hypothetical protein
MTFLAIRNFMGMTVASPALQQEFMVTVPSGFEARKVKGKC